uniref:Potassium channel domain-containing protein n=1 Tax=Romanomermis culicivorax TaxID=13658 RepID=A0A915KL05_ROMCU
MGFYGPDQAQQAQAQSDSEARNMDILSLPLSFVCLMTIAWVVLAAALFLLWENGWSYFNSFYFTVVSFSTVGLGDMTPDYTRTTVLLSIIFMLAGVALLSAFFSLLREQTDSLFDQLESDVDKQYLSGQLMADRALPMSTESNEIDAEIKNLLTKMPWSAKILYWLSSEKRKKNLAKRWSKKANRRPIGTQTEEKYLGSSGFGRMGGNRRASDGEALINNRKSKCDVDSLVDMCDYDI